MVRVMASFSMPSRCVTPYCATTTSCKRLAASASARGSSTRGNAPAAISFRVSSRNFWVVSRAALPDLQLVVGADQVPIKVEHRGGQIEQLRAENPPATRPTLTCAMRIKRSLSLTPKPCKRLCRIATLI